MVKSREISLERGRTIFLDEIGYSTKGRILDFLLTGRLFDYSKTDIAEGSGANKGKVYKIIDSFIKKGYLIESKKIISRGRKIQLYRLNDKNDIVKALINLEDEILKIEVKRLRKK